jgi:hypothetical protein
VHAGVADERPSGAVRLAIEVRQIGCAVVAFLLAAGADALGEVRARSSVRMNAPSMSRRMSGNSSLGAPTNTANRPSSVLKEKMTRRARVRMYNSKSSVSTSLQ